MSEITTRLRKINDNYRADIKFKTLEEVASSGKKGCLAGVLGGIGAITFLFLIFLFIIAEKDSNITTFLPSFMAISLVLILVAIIVSRPKKLKNINIHSLFYKLEVRYNDLENNLREINAQMMDDDNTYVVTKALYLTKDWIVPIDGDCVKIKDITHAFYASVISGTGSAKVRTDQLIAILQSGENVKFLGNLKAIEDAIQVLKQRNPNIFTSKEEPAKTGL